MTSAHHLPHSTALLEFGKQMRLELVTACQAKVNPMIPGQPFIDRCAVQADAANPMPAKFAAYHWDVDTINGHTGLPGEDPNDESEEFFTQVEHDLDNLRVVSVHACRLPYKVREIMRGVGIDGDGLIGDVTITTPRWLHIEQFNYVMDRAEEEEVQHLNIASLLCPGFEP
jgi:hypothetical protein